MAQERGRLRGRLAGRYGLACGIMAALAGGAYADWDELAKVITADRVICPDMQAHAVYEKQRVVFNELYARNRDLMKSL